MGKKLMSTIGKNWIIVKCNAIINLSLKDKKYKLVLEC